MRGCGYILVGFVTVLSARAASAEVYSGTLCNASAADVPSMNYNQFGIFNVSTAARTALCGGATGGNITGVSATVYDRSVADNVRCTLFITNEAGGTLFSQTVVSAGFSSGPINLVFAPPPISGVVHLECVLPANHPTNGPSVVTSYTIKDSQ